MVGGLRFKYMIMECEVMIRRKLDVFEKFKREDNEGDGIYRYISIYCCGL